LFFIFSLLVSVAESAMFDIIALLDASVAPKAEPLAAEFLEYLDYMDYNKYYDAMPTRKVGVLLGGGGGWGFTHMYVGCSVRRG
jgi:dihydroxyacetone kinase